MSFLKAISDYRSALLQFRSTFENLEDALAASLTALKIPENKQNLHCITTFREFLRSGSDKIARNGDLICARQALQLPIALVEESLITALHTAKARLAVSPLDPKELVFDTPPDWPAVQEKLAASKQTINQYFSGIEDAHKSILESISLSPDGADIPLSEPLKAAFENARNPLFITKNELGSPVDISSLHLPSHDPSRDPVTRTMQECCNSWIMEQFISDNFADKALQQVEQSYQSGKTLAKDILTEDKVLQVAMRNIAKRVTDAVAVIEAYQKKRKEPLRVALVGYMSHGKSSFVNSLIGQQLVISESKASTACPMVIKHAPRVEGSLEPPMPRLEIDQVIFSDYLETLRELGALRESHDIDDSNCKAQHAVRNATLSPRHKESLESFEAGFQFRPFYDGKEKIIKAQEKIQDLIRLCARFSDVVRKSPPKPKGSKWPTLYVHMDQMEMLNGTFEIVDLPGYGDPDLCKDVRGQNPINPSVTEQSHRDVLNSVDGVILIAALVDELMTSHSLEVMTYGRNGIPEGQAPLLLTVGTKKDLQSEKTWSKESEETFSGLIFHTNDSISPRLVKTASGLYLNAIQAKYYFESLQAANKSLPKELTEIKESNPVAYGELARKYGYTGSQKRCQREYAKANLPEIIEDLDEEIDACNFRLLREKISTYVISDGRKRDQVLELAELSSLIEQVHEADGAALRASHGSSLLQTEIEEQRIALVPKTAKICDEWSAQKMSNIGPEVIEIIQGALSTAFNNAERSLDSCVDKCLAKYTIPGSKSTLKSVTEGIDFLLDVELALKTELNVHQQDAVETVRANAGKIWSKSIQGLQATIHEALVLDNGEEDNATFNKLKKDLDNDLNNLSLDSISLHLQHEIEEEITRMSPSSPRPEAKAQAKKTIQNGMLLLDTKEKQLADWNEKRMAVTDGLLQDAQCQTAAQGPVIEQTLAEWIAQMIEIGSPKDGQDQTKPGPETIADPTSTTTLVQERIVAVGDTIGLLIRAPALASAVNCPLTKAVWPWITMPAGFPVDVDPDLVKKEYRTRVLGHWKHIMAKECIDSIAGAIRLSVKRGKICVTEFMDKRADELSAMVTSNGRLAPFPAETLDQLVLLRANAISTGLVTRMVGQKLVEKIKKSDPRAGKGLSKF